MRNQNWLCVVTEPRRWASPSTAVRIMAAAWPYAASALPQSALRSNNNNRQQFGHTVEHHHTTAAATGSEVEEERMGRLVGVGLVGRGSVLSLSGVWCMWMLFGGCGEKLFWWWASDGMKEELEKMAKTAGEEGNPLFGG